MNAVVAGPLDALESSLNKLIVSLTSTPTFSPAPAATNALLSADDALTSALVTLRRHQENYALILSLRAEATRVEDAVKEIVRTCGGLRAEIDRVHPSILGDDSSSDDECQQDVDYRTLLSFAQKIGRHNAAAAREAEQDSVRRKVEAKKKPHPITNGATNVATVQREDQTGTDALDIHETWLEERTAAVRAAQGMAFPAAERLRRGALGQLQVLREQSGEEAVDREMEMILDPGLASQAQQTRTEALAEPRGEANEQQHHQQTRKASAPRPQAPNAPAKKLDLDLWNEDDEEED